jgi:DNA modification methylase
MDRPSCDKESENLDKASYQFRIEFRKQHICPLQLQVIERGIELWTNPGDLVLDPFMGIGSTGFAALKRETRFWGCELKESYFKQAVSNLHCVKQETAPLFFGVPDEEISDYIRTRGKVQ